MGLPETSKEKLPLTKPAGVSVVASCGGGTMMDLIGTSAGETRLADTSADDTRLDETGADDTRLADTVRLVAAELTAPRLLKTTTE